MRKPQIFALPFRTGLCIALILSGLISQACRAATQKPAGKKDQADQKAAKPVVAVISGDTALPFWKSVHAGANLAGREAGSDILWQAPAPGNDRKGRMEAVRKFVGRKVDAIVVAPLEGSALARPLEDAAEHGIRIIAIGSGGSAGSKLDLKAVSARVGMDDSAAGRMAALEMADALTFKDTSTPPPGKIKLFRRPAGKVLVLRYRKGSAPEEERVKGFLDGLKEYAPDVKLLPSDRYAGATADSALAAARNALAPYPKVDGIFTPNASTTAAMLRALKDSGRTGRSKLIGFGGPEPLIAALEAGEIRGLVLEDPFRVGYLGVQAALAAIRGEKPEDRMEAGFHLVSADSLSISEIGRLLPTFQGKGKGKKGLRR